MPVLFIPHGGGPWPFVDLPSFERSEVTALAEFLRSLPQKLPSEPKSVLVVSAHWEESVPTVMSAPRPPMLYDYFGFPPEAYEITWPAPGDPRLAAHVRDLLGDAGFETAADAERGFDHGTFIPLKVMYPKADVPTIQLSILRNLEPATHVAIGSALAPLRDDGILIVGSGMSYHNLRNLMTRQGRAESEAFDAWLRDAATADLETRSKRLQGWHIRERITCCHSWWWRAPRARIVARRDSVDCSATLAFRHSNTASCTARSPLPFEDRCY
jgi:aromatic ring-opening dioxygenase catalytic subunit (LigB family)